MNTVNGRLRCPHLKMNNRSHVAWKCDACGDGGWRMRALSLHNPYPHLILDLPNEHWKNIENRVRPVTKLCGPLLLHAAARCSDSTHAAAIAVARKAGVPEELMPGTDQPTMSLVGAVYVGDILPRTSLHDLNYRWKFRGHVGYVLTKRVKFAAPRELPGAQGLFHVDLTPEEAQCCIEAGLLP